MTALLTEEIPAITGAGSNNTISSAEEYQSLAERLGEALCWVSVSIGRYRGKIPLKEATVECDGEALDTREDVSTPSLYLMPRDWDRRLSRLEGQLRRLVERRTVKVATTVQVPMADGSVREERRILSDVHIVPRLAEPSIREELLETARQLWWPAVEEFIQSWPAIVAELRKSKSAKVLARIEHDLPQDGEALRKYFAVTYMPLPLGIRVDELTVAALEQGSGDYLSALRESILHTTVTRLQDACNTLTERIATKGVVKNANLQAVTEALNCFRSFSEAMKTEHLEAQLQAAEALLAQTTVAEVNASSRHNVGTIANQLSNILGAIQDQLPSPSAPSGYGRKQRAIG